MLLTRKQFALGAAASLIGGTVGSRALAQDKTAAPVATPAAGNVVTTPHAANQDVYFYQDSSFEFVFLGVLGSAYAGAANPGTVLYISKQVKDGDSEGAFQAFKAAGDDAITMAEAAMAAGNTISARQAYFWASNYYSTSTYFVDGSADPSRFLPTWELEDDAWKKGIALLENPGEEVWIPYENTKLRGFYFRGNGKGDKRPLLVFTNGSDGSNLDALVQGGLDALARGYDVLTYDGPGQNYALWKQSLYFRPDWEKVITPVIDYALSREDVDEKRIVMIGISQGGYWVPRAMAFEKRIAAGVADPGIVDVSTSWTASLPPPMMELLKSGNKAEFDGFMEKALPPEAKAGLAFRMRPFGSTSYFDVFTDVLQYNLTSVAPNITAPLLVTAPDNEAFWPGQSQDLVNLLKGKATLQPFSAAEGADLHCEIKAYGIRELRIWNWLAQTVG